MSSDASRPLVGGASSTLLARSPAYGPASPLAYERVHMLPAACACRYAPTAKDLASRDVVSLVVGTDAPDDASTSTRGYVVDQLPDRLRRWCFDLTKRNMEAMYTRTWGWSNPEKRRELAHSDARFLVAFKHKHPHRNDDDAADDDDDTPIGFVHFRFEVEDSDGSPVAYVYELQVEDEMKGRGVGTALMAAVESIAKHTEMTRTALTVLKTNKGASLFYERRGYVKDPDTPRDEACHYVILTKPTVKRG